MWVGLPLGVGCWLEYGRFGDWLSVSNAFRLASRFSDGRVSVGVRRAEPILRPRSGNIDDLWDWGACLQEPWMWNFGGVTLINFVMCK